MITHSSEYRKLIENMQLLAQCAAIAYPFRKYLRQLETTLEDPQWSTYSGYELLRLIAQGYLSSAMPKYTEEHITRLIGKLR